MIRGITLLILSILLIFFAVRYAISKSAFFREGIMEGIQSCKTDDDCKWVESGCCSCSLGGGEALINKDKETSYNLLVKPLCLQEETCRGEDVCNYEEVYCDRVCKFGERIYEKPLLIR